MTGVQNTLSCEVLLEYFLTSKPSFSKNEIFDRSVFSRDSQKIDENVS